MANYYEILGVNQAATTDEINQAYKKLAMKWHPDRWSSKSIQEQDNATEQFKKYVHARDILIDDTLRKRHDAELGGESRARTNEREYKPEPRKPGTPLQQKIIDTLKNPDRQDYEKYFNSASKDEVSSFFTSFLTMEERTQFVKNAAQFNIAPKEGGKWASFFGYAFEMERYLSGAQPITSDLVGYLLITKDIMGSRANEYINKFTLSRAISVDVYLACSTNTRAGSLSDAQKSLLFIALMNTPLTFADAQKLLANANFSQISFTKNFAALISDWSSFGIGANDSNAQFLLWAALSQSKSTIGLSVYDLSAHVNIDLYNDNFRNLPQETKARIIKNLQMIPQEQRSDNVNEFLKKNDQSLRAEAAKEKAVQSHDAVVTSVSDLTPKIFNDMTPTAREALTKQLKFEIKSKDSTLFIQALDKLTGNNFTQEKYSVLGIKASNYLAEPSSLFRHKSPDSIAMATLIDNFITSKKGASLTSEDKLVLYLMMNPYMVNGKHRTFSASVRSLYNDLHEDVKASGAYELHQAVKPTETSKILHAHGAQKEEQKKGKNVEVNAILHPNDQSKDGGNNNNENKSDNRRAFRK